jgi:hypothetical protein
MVVSKEIGKYELLLISHYNTTPDQIAFVYFYDPAELTWGMQGSSKPVRRCPLMCSLQMAFSTSTFMKSF